MTQESLVRLDSLEIDGRSLCFESAVVVLDLDMSGSSHWYAVMLHPSSSDLEGPAGDGSAVAQTVDGERLSGRVSLKGLARGAGSLRLTGIGRLDRE
jgi:hypothetical protein